MQMIRRSAFLNIKADASFGSRRVDYESINGIGRRRFSTEKFQ